MSQTPIDGVMYHYPVSDRNSTVLGYGALSKVGRKCWAELDWRAVNPDGGVHLMNPHGGEYLHVRCKWSRRMDGPGRPTLKYRRWYRVRCRRRIGTRWRGGEVTAVAVFKSRGQWEWVVTVSK